MRELIRFLFASKGDILGPGYVRDGVDWFFVLCFILAVCICWVLFTNLLPGASLWLFLLCIGITGLVAGAEGDFWHYSKKDGE